MAVERTLKQIKVFDVCAEGLRDYRLDFEDKYYAKEEIWESNEKCLEILENAKKSEEAERHTGRMTPVLRIYWKTVEISEEYEQLNLFE